MDKRDSQERVAAAHKAAAAAARNEDEAERRRREQRNEAQRRRRAAARAGKSEDEGSSAPRTPIKAAASFARKAVATVSAKVAAAKSANKKGKEPESTDGEGAEDGDETDDISDMGEISEDEEDRKKRADDARRERKEKEKRAEPQNARWEMDDDGERVHKTVRCYCASPARVFLVTKEGSAWKDKWACACPNGMDAGCGFIMLESAAVQLPDSDPLACIKTASAALKRAQIYGPYKNDRMEAALKKTSYYLEMASSVARIVQARIRSEKKRGGRA